ncbi:MAG TPA: hypothetical protein PLV52_04535, partial [Candidatus Omnitrophota bacterium]|nr:hypothetical protein [Candidatus Omnitrophota bacterium]
MSILSFKNHIWVKIVAVLLVVTFVNQDIVWAQDAVTPVSKPASSSGNPQSIDNKAFFKPNNVNASINIPKNLATVRESWSPSAAVARPGSSLVIASPEGAKQSNKEIASSPDGKSPAPRNDDANERTNMATQAPRNDDALGKTIINIQDAHAYLGAQESIVSILDTLVRDYDIKIVAVEGTSGYIDTSLLKTFPDQKVRDDTARSLMKEGKMSAGEFFSVTSEKPVALYGIEEDELYKKNVEELKIVCERGEAAGSDVKNALSLLRKLAGSFYSEELRALESNLSLYKEGKIPFKYLWSTLSPVAAKAGMNLEPYKYLKKLAFLTNQEKSIDFEKANDERKAIISAITSKLIKNELEVFVSSIMEFKKGLVSSGDFHTYLKSTAERNGVDPKGFPSFFKYTEYISEYEKIDLPSIPQELRDYSVAIKNKLFRNDDEKELDLCIRFMEYAGGLFSLQLGNDEFSDLISINRSLGFKEFVGILERVSGKAGLDIGDAGYIKNIFEALPDAVSFYTTAEERN